MCKEKLLRLMALISAAAMLTSGFALTAGAEAQTNEPSGTAVTAALSGETYEDYEYRVFDSDDYIPEGCDVGTIEITKYTGSDSNVTIPAEITG